MIENFEPFDGEECCDLCGAFSDDCHLIPDSGQLVCQRCIKEQLGQMRLAPENGEATSHQTPLDSQSSAGSVEGGRE